MQNEPATPPPATVKDLPAPSRSLRNGTGYILALALAALVFAAFQPTIDNDFVGYDDPDYVTANLEVQRGLTWETARHAFTTSEAGNWHPLTWLSHMLDVQLYGLNPSGHHLTSLVLHTLSSVLVFIVLGTMTGSTWRSFLVAALFGLHPLRVESVAWVAERKDVLSTLFWLLTLWTYAGYAKTIEAKTDANRRRAKIFFALALLCFVGGLLSKAMLVTLPFVLLLLDYWPLNRLHQKQFSALIWEKSLFFLLSFLASCVTFFVQRSAGAVNETMTLGYRISNVLISYVRYLGKLFWPTDLAFFYPHPQHWPLLLVLSAAGLLAVISAVAIRLRQRQPSLLVGWCWLLGTLVPVIGLAQVGQQSIADRYTYIPSLGILIALVWGIHAFTAARRQLAQGFAWTGAAAVLVCLVLTRQQALVWRSTESLCRHAIAATPGNYVAHDMLGAVLEKAGKLDDAFREHVRALEIKPDYADAHNNLGVALQHQHKVAEAMEHFHMAFQLRTRYPEAHFNLGVALENTDRLEEAASEYTRAIELRRDYPDAHYNLGLVLVRLGQLEPALVQFQETLRLNPNLADAHNNLGVIYDRQGRLDLAITEYQQAIAVQPDYPRAHFNLGVALGKAGQLAAAAQEFEIALRQKPDYLEAQTNLDAARAALTPPSPARP